MALAKYKYSSQTVTELTSDIPDGGTVSIVKLLEGNIGVVLQVQCYYGSGATKGLEVRVSQGLADGEPLDSSESAVIAFEMPYASGSTRTVSVPVLLPETGPKIRLEMTNDTGDSASVLVKSRLIEGVEIL